MGEIRILALTGEVDTPGLPGLGEQIDTLIRAGSTRFVLNLKQLRFISSSALGFVLRTAKRVRALDGEVVLSEPTASFRATAETLGLDQVVRVFASDADAVEHLGGVRGDGGDLGRPAQRPWSPSCDG